MSRVRVRACLRSELDRETVIAVALPKGHDHKPREALVLLSDTGEPRAYLNRCRHLPIPIDCGSKQYLSKDGEHLLCATHGALYRREDGLCIAGPCRMLALETFPLEEVNGELFVVISGVSST